MNTLIELAKKDVEVCGCQITIAQKLDNLTEELYWGRRRGIAFTYLRLLGADIPLRTYEEVKENNNVRDMEVENECENSEDDDPVCTAGQEEEVGSKEVVDGPGME